MCHAAAHSFQLKGYSARTGISNQESRHQLAWQSKHGKRACLAAITLTAMLLSGFMYGMLHHSQQRLSRRGHSSGGGSDRVASGLRRRQWRRQTLAAEVRLRQQCRAAFVPAGSRTMLRVHSIAIVGNGILQPAYRAELRGVMQYVVRLDQMSSWAPGERTDLWLLSWDVAAQHFRGAAGKDGAPASEVLAGIRALWFVGGSAGDVSATLQGWQEGGLLHSRNGKELQWAHFPHSSWRDDHPETLPAGGQPSSGFMAVVDVLGCLPGAVRLHLYGLPWLAGTPAAGYRPDPEGVIVRLPVTGKVVIHEISAAD